MKAKRVCGVDLRVGDRVLIIGDNTGSEWIRGRDGLHLSCRPRYPVRERLAALAAARPPSPPKGAGG